MTYMRDSKNRVVPKPPPRRDTLRESLLDKGIDCDKVIHSTAPNESPTGQYSEHREREKLISDALDNTITALGQGQKGTARQFLRSAINAALADERQTSDGLGKLNDDLRQQLLSAQAAIGAMARVKEGK